MRANNLEHYQDRLPTLRRPRAWALLFFRAQVRANAVAKAGPSRRVLKKTRVLKKNLMYSKKKPKGHVLKKNQMFSKKTWCSQKKPGMHVLKKTTCSHKKRSRSSQQKPAVLKKIAAGVLKKNQQYSNSCLVTGLCVVTGACVVGCLSWKHFEFFFV